MPDLIIAGVPKAGTSSFFDWLDDHPMAQGSTPKETCFFMDPDSHAFRSDFNFSLGLQHYHKAFAPSDRPVRLLFEATPAYIYSQTALAEIPRLENAPKCLFVLREPASQIRSVYHYFSNNWAYIPAEMSFADFLEAAERGTHDFGGNELARHALDFADYLPWLRRWRDRLGDERMKICLFEDLKRDPAAFMSGIATWCGIDPRFYDDYAFEASNESYEVVNRRLHRLNMAIRDRLPKGPTYELVRGIYRRFNTRPAKKGQTDDVFLRLREKFEATYDPLESEFGLDLSAWRERG
ncbi:sulfotransferase family protein [Ruegeria aquimaris]|uniref:Sulfotransferase domain-containing protein n=1 Tax=Ruegeria aquimaris TaxID=2984333 RepID=A0ABT3ADY6_9RHOB|nr:sulfotransferase [Ruegeria sp. XHP0148]MCV2886855.1 sulfotransferase domain-containing protein [Ruegeria sp. XHP0148]